MLVADDAGLAARLGNGLDGEESPPLAGGDDSPRRQLPGERPGDLFLHGDWDFWMPIVDPEVLMDYGVEVSEEEVARGPPWRSRPRPPAAAWAGFPRLNRAHIFGPYPSRVAGGAWVLPDGRAVQEPYIGWSPGLGGGFPIGQPAAPPVRVRPPPPAVSVPAPARPPPAVAARARPGASSASARVGARLLASTRFCSTCGLASCFCPRRAETPPSYAQHLGARPQRGSLCQNHYFCLCDGGSCERFR